MPIGLSLANIFSWHAPFFMLAAACLPVLAAAYHLVPSIRANQAPAEHRSPAGHLVEILVSPGHMPVFSFVGAVTLGGFIVVPYISPYMVRNVGLREYELPYIYLVGGLCTIFSMNLVGRLADQYRTRRIFSVMVLSAIPSTLLLTNLPPVRTALAVAATTLFMICMSGRFVPAMALMTSAVTPKLRGGFMGVSSAVQHLASGLGSFLGGMILGQSSQGTITGYRTVGVLSAAVALVSLALCFTLAGTAPQALGTPETLEPALWGRPTRG